MFEQWLKWAAICWIMLSLQGCEQSSTQQPYQPTAAPHHKEHYMVGISRVIYSQPLMVEQAEAYIRHYQA